MSGRSSIIVELVKMAQHHYTGEELLQLQEEMDGTPEDIFFEELTEQLAERFPEHFVNDSVGEGKVVPVESNYQKGTINHDSRHDPCQH